VVLTFSEHARALLYNGLGRYEAALPAAESASAQDELGVSVWSLPALVEAARRTDNSELAAAALDRLTERTQAAGTEWALGIDARSRALLSDGTVAISSRKDLEAALSTKAREPQPGERTSSIAGRQAQVEPQIR
jgi:hypothetical protein